ncbi:hypothetical protein EDB80DRAFT_708152 [Ilyonectria destructans]|nr:hypothetical protein EDB80DRAFT_708152 [Ilyonectria destructans]
MNYDGPSSSGNESTRKKKQKTEESDFRYSCPYRKRLPWTFNVRDHQTCATQSFSSITLVKRHIMTAHQLRNAPTLFQCDCCNGYFRTVEDFDIHIVSCGRSSGLYPTKVVLGIDRQMEDKLRDRRASTQVLKWDTLWKTIFPKGDTIPSPEFEPVVEGHEAMGTFFTTFHIDVGVYEHLSSELIDARLML